MKFKLFEKLASLEGLDLIMLIVAAVLFAVILFYAVKYRSKLENRSTKVNTTRALVYGALCLTLSFVLSYIKLFSMPLGGSITLASMLPLMMYASAFGPFYGFAAAFAYALLQIIQGAWIVHPVQFILDYFVAFTCLGLPSLFRDKLTLGVIVAGFSRMLVSTVSGAIFFADSGLDYGFANPWTYSFLYNLLTIGVDTLICAGVSLVPAIKKLRNRMC